MFVSYCGLKYRQPNGWLLSRMCRQVSYIIGGYLYRNKEKYIELSSSSISIILGKSRIAIGFPKIFFKIKCVVNNNTLLIRAFGSMDWLRQSVSYKGLALNTVMQLSSLPATIIPDGLVAC